MKKHIVSILMVAAVLGLTSGAQGVTHTNIQDQAVTDDFALSHSVARSSYFKTTVLTSAINPDVDQLTHLGSIAVKNNTLDGYKLSLVSAGFGMLKPALASANSLDGEADIPYSIELSKSGSVGTGIDVKEAFTASELANGEVDILVKAGESVSSATDAQFDLKIKMETSSDVLAMAGTYTDTITITYSDL